MIDGFSGDLAIMERSEPLFQQFLEPCEFAGFHVVTVLGVGILLILDLAGVGCEGLDSTLGQIVVALRELRTRPLNQPPIFG